MIKPQVVILTAGRGSRMYPFTLYRPVALCPVANIPLLSRLLQQLQVGKINEAVLAFPSRAFMMTDLAYASAVSGFDLRVLFPQAPELGQVGNVREAAANTEGPVLVIYGDSFLDADFRNLITSHEATRTKGGLATLLYHKPKDLRRAESHGRTYHGVLSVDTDGKLTRFVEKPTVEDICEGFDLASAAVFVMERDLLYAKQFENATNFSFDIFEPAIREGLPIYGCDIGTGFRYDAGQIERWHQLNMKVLRREISASIPGREIASSIWVEEHEVNSKVQFHAPVVIGEGVEFLGEANVGPEVIIGHHCVIGAGASIQRCVVMDDCSIGAGSRLEGCLIGPHCKLGDQTILIGNTVLGPYTVVGQSAWPSWTEGQSGNR